MEGEEGEDGASGGGFAVAGVFFLDHEVTADVSAGVFADDDVDAAGGISEADPVAVHEAAVAEAGVAGDGFGGAPVGGGGAPVGFHDDFAVDHDEDDVVEIADEAVGAGDGGLDVALVVDDPAAGLHEFGDAEGFGAGVGAHAGNEEVGEAELFGDAEDVVEGFAGEAGVDEGSEVGGEVEVAGFAFGRAFEVVEGADEVGGGTAFAAEAAGAAAGGDAAAESEEGDGTGDVGEEAGDLVEVLGFGGGDDFGDVFENGFIGGGGVDEVRIGVGRRGFVEFLDDLFFEFFDILLGGGVDDEGGLDVAVVIGFEGDEQEHGGEEGSVEEDGDGDAECVVTAEAGFVVHGGDGVMGCWGDGKKCGGVLLKAEKSYPWWRGVFRGKSGFVGNVGEWRAIEGA